ncbi:hypothetical protein P170DRAFT_71441 [Aspergillus steynii IBT 23096]|uniref:Uncharacterized protein n=1 Tax=Aspergillus steynii IBT 23096 TaxID=1392250 RepID=A0A2I2FR37_9EURO|nr:uncharacterized protein P170DRAFT_71441 [Aspergillus steynii IBT 23096]PLB43095.1 hypothetical protein P170DRAFT_71441 [Aspergillus steynii IBT 23096]
MILRFHEKSLDGTRGCVRLKIKENKKKVNWIFTSTYLLSLCTVIRMSFTICRPHPVR